MTPRQPVTVGVRRLVCFSTLFIFLVTSILVIERGLSIDAAAWLALSYVYMPP